MRAGSRVVNIVSISSDFMPVPGHAVYAMTKGAVATLTRGLACDLGSYGMTINNVQPGRVDTALLRAVLGPMADQARASVAVGRFGECEEVAGLVSYLMGPGAAFITGSQLKGRRGASA